MDRRRRACQPLVAQSDACLFTMTTPVAIFKWLGAIPDEPTGIPERISGDDGEQMTYEAAFPAAMGLVKALRDAGVECDDPFPGTLGWLCDVRYRNRKIPLFINWTAIDYPPHNYIGIQWDVSSTWSELLRWKPVPTEVESEAQEVIDRVLRSMSDVCDVQWLTDEQFDASYRQGKPLPKV